MALLLLLMVLLMQQQSQQRLLLQLLLSGLQRVQGEALADQLLPAVAMAC